MILNVLVGGLFKAMNCRLGNRKAKLSAARQLAVDDDGLAVLEHHLSNLQDLLAVLDCEIRDSKSIIHKIRGVISSKSELIFNPRNQQSRNQGGNNRKRDYPLWLLIPIIVSTVVEILVGLGLL
jgi:hypothetical protein